MRRDPDETLEQLCYSVMDDRTPDVPAITTLLYKVCEKDRGRFEEATRLLTLFMTAAFEAGKASR